mmetsp:Transcript_114834/g.161311  ORF Transcript_114834/g.161311 Transcript_114834/m.161311 type:complete len:235 (-) Transcript_114834:516-1220(-)
MMTGRYRTVLMNLLSQHGMAFHILQLRSITQHLFLTFWAFSTSLQTNLGKELVVLLTVLNDAHQTCPCLVLHFIIGILPGPIGLGNIDIPSIHTSGSTWCHFIHTFQCHLNLANGFILERFVTKAANVTLVGALRNGSNLMFKGLRCEFAQIIIFHPADGEQISQAGTNVLSLYHGSIATVGTPRGFLTIGCSNCKNLTIFLEIWEHGTTFTCFHIEHQLFKHLLTLHFLQSLG